MNRNDTLYAIYVRFCLSKCNLYEVLQKIENLFTSKSTIYFDRLILFTASDLGLLIERLYSTSCTEDLYWVIASERLDSLLSDRETQKRIADILVENIKWKKSFNIDFLDIGRLVPPSIKNDLRSKLILDISEKLSPSRPYVSRSNPSIDFRFIFLDDNRALVAILLKKYRKDRFQYRWTEKRPYSQPSALTPYHSLVLYNLASAKPCGNDSCIDFSEPFLDPFAGTGSVLIESALQGVYSIGIDLNYKQIRGSRRNIIQLGLHAVVDLVISDSVYMPLRGDSFRAIAFDPPYGRAASTHGRDPRLLLEATLETVRKILKRSGRAVFLSIDKNKISANETNRICEILEHSSLIRHLYVMKNV